jgi:hypothetical protein
MAVKTSEEYDGDVNWLNKELEIVVGEDARIVIFWDTRYKCHCCECSAGIILVNMRLRKLAKGRLECFCCIIGEYITLRSSVLRLTITAAGGCGRNVDLNICK